MRAVVVRVAIVRTAGLRLRRYSFGPSCRRSRFLGLRLRSRPVIAGASTRSGGEASRPAALDRVPWRECDEDTRLCGGALLVALNNVRSSVPVRRPPLWRCVGGGFAGCEGTLRGDRGAGGEELRSRPVIAGAFPLFSPLPSSTRTTRGSPVGRAECADPSDQLLAMRYVGPLPLNVAPSSCCRPLTRWPSSSLRRCGRLPPPRLDCAADGGLALGRVLPLPLLLLLLQPLLQLLLQLLLLILLASSSLRPLSRASEPLLRSSQEGDPSLRALLLFGWLELAALDLTLRIDFIHICW